MRPVSGDGARRRAARCTGPGCFTIVMATGIVSAALRLAGWRGPAGTLLALAAVAFVIQAAVSGWRVARHPGLLRADLTAPGTAFTAFAFVAACGVVGNGLAAAGYLVPAAALAAAALVAWLALTGLIPARMAARKPARPRLGDVSGSWYLWPVAAQSLAIAAAYLQAGGLLPARLAATAAITAWLAGIVLYLTVSVLVAARLLRAGLGPLGRTAAYWVTMGAASISVLAAAQILAVAGAPPVAVIRPAVTSAAVALWALATALIPVLAAITAARYVRRPSRWRYHPAAWTVAFPLGMYATASLRLGTVAGMPLIRAAGTAAVWPAAAVWAVTFAAMAAALTWPARPRRRSPARPAAGTRRPCVTITPWQRYKCQAVITPIPADGCPDAALPGPVFRAAIRTRNGQLLTGLITTSEDPPGPGHAPVIATVVAVGDDPADCLPAGAAFALWRGRDIGRGVVSRQIFT